MRLTYRTVVFFFWMACVLLLGCTENPFFSEDQISNNAVRGRVELSDSANPKDVYVWFKVFDVSVRTDEDGYFELQLPSPASQPNGGIDGVYPIYFYVANYRIDSVEVLLFRGNVKYSEQGLNDKGELAKRIQLLKILDIKVTSVDHVTTTPTLEGIGVIQITFTFQAFNHPVWLSCAISNQVEKDGFEFLIGFIRKVDAAQDSIKMISYEGRSYTSRILQLKNQTVNLRPLLIIGLDEIPPGEYEVIPYLIIQQEYLPAGLMNSIGTGVMGFTPDFLKIPLKISGNRIRIQ